MLDDHSENSEFWSGVPDRRRRRRSSTASSTLGQEATNSRRARVARTLNSRDTGAHREITRDITRPNARPTARPVEPTTALAARRTAHRRANQSMRRAAVLGVTVLLLVPVAMALRAEAEGPRQVAPLATTPATVAPTFAQVAALDASDASAKVAIEALQPIVPEPTDPPTTAVGQLAVTTAKATPTAANQATAKQAAAKPAPVKKPAPKAAVAKCVPYTVRAGDAWIVIARRAGVSLSSLLTLNKARTTTSLMPGRSICLPAGATIPAATQRPTAKPPATTVKASTVKASTSGTTHATAPATTLPELIAPANNFTRDEVAQIIRDVWPDDLEDHAIEIADRESHLNPSARNFCCYGLFQIYYSVHRTWLASIGVTDAAQLWDPKVNALVAYQIYLRSGFAPWGG